nr:hypothetical protein [uncultured Flavobacterium sp.]
MLSTLKNFRENILLFSLSGYGLALIYLSIYYYCFDVPIIYYLSLNDMLLFAVTLIMPALLVVLFVEYVIIRLLKKQLYKRQLEPNEEKKFNNICIVVIGLLTIVLLFINYIKINPNLLFNVILSSFLIVAKIESKDPENRNISPFIAVAGLFIGLFFSVTYSKSGSANKDVKFNYDGKTVQTCFCYNLNYLGETSSTIFLYDFKKKITFVYEKADISNLTYIDKIEKEYSKKSNLKLYSLSKVIKKRETDTIYRPYEWYTYDNKSYWLSSEKNAVGLSRLMWELDYILNENEFDYDTPSHEHSSLPSKLNIKDDFEAASKALNSGNSELHKKWIRPSGEIELQLNKGSYAIQIVLKKRKN